MAFPHSCTIPIGFEASCTLGTGICLLTSTRPLHIHSKKYTKSQTTPITLPPIPPSISFPFSIPWKFPPAKSSRKFTFQLPSKIPNLKSHSTLRYFPRIHHFHSGEVAYVLPEATIEKSSGGYVSVRCWVRPSQIFDKKGNLVCEFESVQGCKWGNKGVSHSDGCSRVLKNEGVEMYRHFCVDRRKKVGIVSREEPKSNCLFWAYGHLWHILHFSSSSFTLILKESFHGENRTLRLHLRKPHRSILLATIYFNRTSETYYYTIAPGMDILLALTILGFCVGVEQRAPEHAPHSGPPEYLTTRIRDRGVAWTRPVGEKDLGPGPSGETGVDCVITGMGSVAA